MLIHAHVLAAERIHVKGRPCRCWPKARRAEAGYGPKGPPFGGGEPRAAVSSTLPIAAPASATASRELCPLDAGLAMAFKRLCRLSPFITRFRRFPFKAHKLN